jgi:uncharacterized protein
VAQAARLEVPGFVSAFSDKFAEPDIEKNLDAAGKNARATIYNILLSPEPAPDSPTTWNSRILAIGQVALFTVLFFALAFAAPALSRHLFPAYRITPAGTMRRALETSLCAAAVTLLLALIHRRNPLSFGWRGQSRLRHFAIGSATGVGLLSLVLVTLSLAGACSFGSLAATGAAALQSGLYYAIAFLGVSFTEESLFRGYPLVTLTRSFSFWPIALLLGAIFGAAHLQTGAENLSGVLFAAVYGVAAAYSYRRSGSLWFAFGFHAAWDFAETYLYGVPDSGIELPGALLRPEFHGPAWLTGGSAGPEGSVLMIAVVAAMIWIIRAALVPAPAGNRDL